jgi:type II secretory pathway pseudopilin PulG
MSTTRFNLRRGFTPIQLIIVLALLLVGAALLAPIVARIRAAAAQAQSQNNLKQIVLGTINLADTYRGKLPAAAGSFPLADKDWGTVHFFILPYIEQAQLYNKGATDEAGIYSPWKNDVAATPVAIYVDPQDTSAPPQFVYKGWLATTSYPCNYLVFKDGTNRYPASITDGTSNTLMFAQRYQMCNDNPTAWGYADWYYWTPMFGYYTTEKFQAAPKAQDCDPARPQSIGGSGIQAAFCDGSARTISARINSETWHALSTPSGGEVINIDF